MTTLTILDCFKMAGVSQDIWTERSKDAGRWFELGNKSTIYNAYLNWTVRREGGPDEASYNKYFPNNPNPQDLTEAEVAEVAAFREKYKSLAEPYQSIGYWLLEYANEAERRKLLRKTPLLLLLVEQDKKYLIENGWRWPLQVKELIEQGYIMSEIRVAFLKDPTAWWTGGTLFRLSSGGMQYRLHRVLEVSGDTITYEPAGFTNYGYMLIKPRSTRPTKESLEKFSKRECKPLKVVQAA